MSEVMIDTSKIKVEVSNCGPITFISDNGKICIIHMHHYDTGQLIKFLVKEGGYDFSGKDVSKNRLPFSKERKAKARGEIPPRKHPDPLGAGESERSWKGRKLYHE